MKNEMMNPSLVKFITERLNISIIQLKSFKICYEKLTNRKFLLYLKNYIKTLDKENTIYDFYNLKTSMFEIYRKIKPSVINLERYILMYNVKGVKLYKDYCKRKTKNWKPINRDTVSLKFHIEKYGEELGKIKYEERLKGINTVDLSYWINKGHSEEEAILLQKERQSTFSLEKCIKKFGKKKGRKIWKERQINWQNTITSKPQDEILSINKKKGITLENMIRKHGPEEGSRRYQKWLKQLVCRGIPYSVYDEKPCKLYYIHFYNEEIEFWKIGITTKSIIGGRFRIKYLFEDGIELKYDLVFVKEYESVYECYVEEQHILENYKSNRITVSYKDFYTTEAFNCDVLKDNCENKNNI